VLRTAIIFVSLLFFVACGYKPTLEYTKNILGDKIYVEVQISLTDPENSVLIRDAINEAIITKFRSKIVTKYQANSQLIVQLNKVSFLPIQYDRNGYVIAYKTYVTLLTNYQDKFGQKSKIISSGDYDFTIESNSVISDTKRFEAIKNASYKAIDEFISKLSIKGIPSDHK